MALRPQNRLTPCAFSARRVLCPFENVIKIAQPSFCQQKAEDGSTRRLNFHQTPISAGRNWMTFLGWEGWFLPGI